MLSPDKARQSSQAYRYEETGPHYQIAKFVLLGVSIAVAIAAVAAIVTAGGEPGTIQQIFTAVITLAGSWGGTVIAYYFSSKNFEAATRQTDRAMDRLAGDAWRAIRLRDAMLKMNEVESFQLDHRDDSEVKLEELKKKFGNMPGKQRLPIIDSRGAVKYLVHLSTLNMYLADKQLAAPGTNPSTNSLKDLLADSDARRMVQGGFMTLSGDDTLAEAKLLMDKNPAVLDIIVTEDGGKESPAVGWITNNDVLEKSHA